MIVVFVFSQYYFCKKRCVFLQTIPDTGDLCPSVENTDHYYCFFGDESGPSWYCTCIELENAPPDTQVFHCNGQRAKSPSELLKYELNEAYAAVANNPKPSPATLKPVAPEATPQPTIQLTHAATETKAEVSASYQAAVKAGDAFDWSQGEPQWWHNMKDQYGHTLRKCVFETRVPDTGDSCPGVASHSDHYFCVWGSIDIPTWYCTCIEKDGDYLFHCNDSELRTPDKIAKIVAVPGAADPAPADDDQSPEPLGNAPVVDEKESGGGGSFLPGLLTGVAVAMAAMVAYKYHSARSAQKNYRPPLPSMEVFSDVTPYSDDPAPPPPGAQKQMSIVPIV